VNVWSTISKIIATFFSSCSADIQAYLFSGNNKKLQAIAKSSVD